MNTWLGNKYKSVSSGDNSPTKAVLTPPKKTDREALVGLVYKFVPQPKQLVILISSFFFFPLNTIFSIFPRISSVPSQPLFDLLYICLHFIVHSSLFSIPRSFVFLFLHEILRSWTFLVAWNWSCSYSSSLPHTLTHTHRQTHRYIRTYIHTYIHTHPTLTHFFFFSSLSASYFYFYFYFYFHFYVLHINNVYFSYWNFFRLKERRRHWGQWSKKVVL